MTNGLSVDEMVLVKNVALTRRLRLVNFWDSIMLVWSPGRLVILAAALDVARNCVGRADTQCRLGTGARKSETCYVISFIGCKKSRSQGRRPGSSVCLSHQYFSQGNYECTQAYLFFQLHFPTALSSNVTYTPPALQGSHERLEGATSTRHFGLHDPKLRHPSPLLKYKE